MNPNKRKKMRRLANFRRLSATGEPIPIVVTPVTGPVSEPKEETEEENTPPTSAKTRRSRRAAPKAAVTESTGE